MNSFDVRSSRRFPHSTSFLARSLNFLKVPATSRVAQTSGASSPRFAIKLARSSSSRPVSYMPLSAIARVIKQGHRIQDPSFLPSSLPTIFPRRWALPPLVASPSVRPPSAGLGSRAC